VKGYGEKAIKVKLSIDKRMEDTNIQYYRDIAVLKNQQVTRLINETIIISDTIEGATIHQRKVSKNE